ncbi:uncharacterized protein B0I36DRAFT_329892 [Microdochium trichocladiopsis]|uniref:Uncharacterized protein n=1 Tax=Microdochium trichocladiopsis TaxID=1682393 RepID=A0A9P9BJZ7_9PEZI|nr:uncharacterized protein B0I36DRAFT_329892 [Microdochium trichocladiopsis]KAH7026109.1 hypothetical protein B0I36DRAFT_329892 [Microdochium trichocladiopsis]
MEFPKQPDRTLAFPAKTSPPARRNRQCGRHSARAPTSGIAGSLGMCVWNDWDASGRGEHSLRCRADGVKSIGRQSEACRL